MAIQNDFRTWSFKAAEDIDTTNAGTGAIYKAVNQATGILANNGSDATGILQYVGKSGEHVTQGWDGIMKFTAGATVAAGAQVTVTTSGYFITATQGKYVVGRSLASVASGAVGYGMFNFVAPKQYDNIADVFEVSAAANLSSAAGLAIDFSTGNVAASSSVAGGVIIDGATSGGTVTAKAVGRVSAKAGAGVTADSSLKITTGGYLIDAGSGDVIIGRASAAAASGAAFWAAVNFATPHYATSSLDVGI